jgi:UDP-2-acetamido-3-amino-2,3-dideoxy-glucuronate N-acetyltransferase
MKNIAVIGSGYWGKNLIRNFNELGSLKYVFDENKDSAKIQNELYGLQECSFEQILNDPEITGVVISTPAQTHHSVAKECLKANKNIFIEKPICLNLDDALDLKSISETKGLVLMVGHLLNYNDHFSKLIEISKNKDLGDLIKIKSVRKSFGKLRDNENVIWSFAPHDISMINRFTKSKFSNLNVIKSCYFNKNCDSAFISYNKDKIKVEIEVDWTSVEKIHKLELFFSNGVLVFEDSQQDPDKKVFHIETAFNQMILMDKSSLEKKYIQSDFTQPLLNECRHFVKCITNKSLPITNVDESIAVLEILLATDDF